MIPYLHYAVKLGYTSAVVRSPDTDLFFLLLHHASNVKLNVYGDIGVRRGRKLYNISELAHSYGEPYCEALLGLYVFTGEDTTSAFKGKGKVLPMKKMQGNQRFQEAFRYNHEIIEIFSIIT